MIDGMQVEPVYFSDADYVLIRVDIGKMSPQAARNYIAKLRNETALCKELDEREIRYDLVGVRDNSSGMDVKTKTEDFTQDAERGCGSKVEKLPSAQGQGEMDDVAYFRQNFIKSLAKVNTRKKETVVADRNDILKTELGDDLKKDSFADAMKLVE